MTGDYFYLKYVCLFESEMMVGPETITGSFKNEIYSFKPVWWWPWWSCIMLLIKNSFINLYSISKIEIFHVKMSIENRKRVIDITLAFLKLPREPKFWSIHS